jgi:hypothetical protein
MNWKVNLFLAVYCAVFGSIFLYYNAIWMGGWLCGGAGAFFVFAGINYLDEKTATSCSESGEKK